MPDRTVTTDTGTTVTLTERDGETLVMLDHPAAPADMRHTEAGRVIEGGFQPAPFASWAVTPSALRAIADLIEGTTPAAESYFAFIEHNEHEAETWTHWIPVSTSAEAEERLRAFVEARKAEGFEDFEIGDVLVNESQVDALVKFSSNTDYIAQHTKLAGVLNLPDELTFLNLYKGGISGFMSVPAEVEG